MSQMIQIDLFAAKNNTKIQEKNTVDYKILNYEKGIVCFDDEDTGKYRSVIISQKTNTVVACGPKKSISLETFKERYPEFEGHIPIDVYLSEIVEGTMINLFFDFDKNIWEIATKNAVGGHYWFFRQYYNNMQTTQQYTFRQMFLEAIGEHVLCDINDSYLVQNLDKNLSYSFVLQHPANHIVLDIITPKVYLVAIFEKSSNNIRNIPLFEYVSENAMLIDKIQYGIFNLPYIHPNNYLEMETFNYASLTCENFMLYFPVGYMLVNTITGDRVTVKSENYERLKEIRGNHANLQYQYISIMRTGKTTEFLHHFPIYTKLFHKFYEQISEYVKSVHTMYLEIYVKKNKSILDNLNKTTRYHLQRIHYQRHVLEKQIVTQNVVFNWFLFSIEPGQLLYILRNATNTSMIRIPELMV
jgi:hypothetical protein